jgi:hypothetical protein
MKPAELFHVTGRTAVVIVGTGEPCGTMAEGFAAAGAQAVSWSHATRNAVLFRITSDSLGMHGRRWDKRSRAKQRRRLAQWISDGG